MEIYLATRGHFNLLRSTGPAAHVGHALDVVIIHRQEDVTAPTTFSDAMQIEGHLTVLYSG